MQVSVKSGARRSEERYLYSQEEMDEYLKSLPPDVDVNSYLNVQRFKVRAPRLDSTRLTRSCAPFRDWVR